jgi:hypothetical protein
MPNGTHQVPQKTKLGIGTEGGLSKGNLQIIQRKLAVARVSVNRF